MKKRERIAATLFPEFGDGFFIDTIWVKGRRTKSSRTYSFLARKFSQRDEEIQRRGARSAPTRPLAFLPATRLFED